MEKKYHNGPYNSSRKGQYWILMQRSDSSYLRKFIVVEILVEVYKVGLANYYK